MFDIRLWQQLNAETAYATGRVNAIQLTAIAPFGFEIMDDVDVFLRMRLKRFFVYLGVNEPVDRQTSHLIQVDYLKRLHAGCRERLGESFCNCRRGRTDQSDVWLGDGPPELHLKHDESKAPTVSSELRVTGNILDEYATYVLWCVFALNAGTLSELQKVTHSHRARRRIIQLHLMHLNALALGRSDHADLLGYLTLPESEAECALFARLLTDRVVGQNQDVVSRLRGPPEATFTGTGLHSERGISFEACVSIAEPAIDLIKQSYLGYSR